MNEAGGSPGWSALPTDFDEAAAGLLADCPTLGTRERAKEAVGTLRAESGELYGWVEAGELIAVYGLCPRGLSFELPWLAVNAARRGERFGRSALVDALRRCGRKPMTIETDESRKGWFERVGFKIVGRRPASDGGHRYRLGWYAPRRPDEPGYGAH